MSSITIIALAITVFGLIKDFQRDSGLNKKAKIYHSILLSLLIMTYAGSFGALGWIIRNFDRAKTQFSVDVGIVPGSLHLAIFFVNLVLSLIVLVFAYQMISRKENARKNMLFFLPFLGLTSIFNFYRGWLNTPDELILNDFTILLIATLIMGGLTLLYLKVYTSEWMKSFFQFKTESIPENELRTQSKLEQ